MELTGGVMVHSRTRKHKVESSKLVFTQSNIATANSRVMDHDIIIHFIKEMKDTHFVNLVILNRKNFLQTLKYTVFNNASISSVQGEDRQIT